MTHAAPDQDDIATAGDTVVTDMQPVAVPAGPPPPEP